MHNSPEAHNPRIENSDVAQDMATLMDQEREAERIWRQGGGESQLRKANELAAAAATIEAAYRAELEAPLQEPNESNPVSVDTEDAYDATNADEDVTQIKVPKSFKLTGTPDSDAPLETPGNSDNGEKERRTERLRQIVADGEFNATAWMRGTGKAPQEMGGGGYSRFQQLHSNPGLAPFLKQFTPDNIKSLFDNEGVSQLLTAEKLDFAFGQIRTDTDKPAEPTFLITYETATNQSSQFKYSDPNGRPGTIFRYNLFLPRPTTEEFLKYAQEDPTILQEVGDIIMREELQAGQDWEDARPPYAEWKAQMGGVVKTALRYDLEAGPEQSKIVSVA